MSQEQLAAGVGIDRRMVQRLEAGTGDARLTWLLGIAHLVHVPIHVLLDVTDGAWQPPDAPRPRRWHRRPQGDGSGR